MPKILIYKLIWLFVIYGTDMYERRMHVHVGKKGMRNLCKIWLEPEISIAEPGQLTIRQQNEVLQIAQEFQNDLILQWKRFTSGENIKAIKVR
ncbi:MAG: DUF4160 domain-containing protein [Bacteroidota bacterium]